MLIFGAELVAGVYLILNPGSSGPVGVISNVLVACLLIGVARAWELVGDRDTGIISSIAVLVGHAPDSADPFGISSADSANAAEGAGPVSAAGVGGPVSGEPDPAGPADPA